MSSSDPAHQDAPEDAADTYLDPSETYEEYADEEHDHDEDHPMSDDEPDEEMGADEDEEIIVDDSIQGFFLHTSPIYSVDLHDTIAATGGGDDLGYLWDITNGEMISKLEGHTDSVTSVAFSKDGVYLATAGMDGQILIWNVVERKLVVKLEAGDEILWINWHPSGPVILGGINDGTVWMWKIPSGAPMQIFSGHTGPCSAGSFSPSGKNIVTCSEDGSLISWVPQTGEVAWKQTSQGSITFIYGGMGLIVDARFDAGQLTSLAINPTSTVVAVGGTEGLVKLLNITNGNILATLGAQTGDSIETLAWATTLPILAVGSTDGRIYLYDTQSYRIRNTLSHDDAVTAIHLPVGGFELTSSSMDKSVRRWDIRTGKEIARRTGHQDGIVGGLAVSKDGKKVITGGDDTVALVWGFD